MNEELSRIDINGVTYYLLDENTKATLESKIGYYECNSEASSASKTIAASNYVLGNGGNVKVKMTNANTADNATLNINSTGAKPLYYAGERASAKNSWEAGETIEVYYDGTSYYANNVAGGSGSGDGAFDVSVEYPTSGVEGGNTYTLEGALAVLNTNLSASKKKGGMSIKFVQSSDNKYVQYRLMANTFSTTVSDWQGVDDEPTAGSNNLVKSGGVDKSICGLYVRPNTSSDLDVDYNVSAYEPLYIKITNNYSGGIGISISLLDSEKNIVVSQTFACPANSSAYYSMVAQSNIAYVRVGQRNAQDIYVNFTTKSSFSKDECLISKLLYNTDIDEIEQNGYALTTIVKSIKANKKCFLVINNSSSTSAGTVMTAYNSNGTQVYTEVLVEKANAKTIYSFVFAQDVAYITLSAPYVSNITISIVLGYVAEFIEDYVNKEIEKEKFNNDNKILGGSVSSYNVFGSATKSVIDACNFSFTTVNSGANNGIKCITSYLPSASEQIFIRMKIKSTANCVLAMDIYSNNNAGTTLTSEKLKLYANEERYITIATNVVLPLLANNEVCLQFVSDGSVATTININELVVTNNIQKIGYFANSKYLNYDTHIFDVAQKGTNCHFNSIYEALCFIKNKDVNIINNTDLYTIQIHEGVYEDEPSISTSAGLQSKYYTFGAAISFIGDDAASCIIRNTITASNQCHIFDIAGSACVKNLTIEVLKSDGLVESDLTRGCYCVHVDRDWNKTGEYYITEVSDCVLYNEVGPCIGAGLRDNQRQRYLNNVMTCAANMVLQGANIAPLYAHAPAIDGTEHNAKLDVIDNTLIQNDDADYAISMGDVIPEYPYSIIPCYFKNNVVYAASGNEIAGQEYFKTTHLLVPYCFGNNVSELNY